MRLGIVRAQGHPFTIVDAALDPHPIMPMFGTINTDPTQFRPMLIVKRKLRPRMLGRVPAADDA